LNSENIKIAGGYTLICLLWGSTWLFIRLGLNSLNPVFSAGFRFAIAALVLLVIIKLRRAKLVLDKTAVLLYTAMGFFMFVFPLGFVYWAEQHISSGLTSVLFTVFPLFVLVFSRMFNVSKTINPYQVTGIILGIIGVVIIFIEDISLKGENIIIAMGLVLISATLQALMQVFIKKYGDHLNPMSMNFIPLLLAGSVMVITSLFIEDFSKNNFDVNAFISVGYLAVFGTIFTFTTYFWLLKKINIVILSLSSFIEPIIALFIGWLVIDESLTFQAFVGSSLVLIGIIFANFRSLINYLYVARK
jgi:drug/metabolite transporter (DMT)-like permease